MNLMWLILFQMGSSVVYCFFVDNDTLPIAPSAVMEKRDVVRTVEMNTGGEAVRIVVSGW